MYPYVRVWCTLLRSSCKIAIFFPKWDTNKMKRGRDFFSRQKSGSLFPSFSAKCNHVLHVNNCRKIKCYLFPVCTLIRLADQIGGKTHCLLWACTILRQSTFAVLCCGLMIQRFLPLSLSHRLYLLIKIPNTFFYLSFDKKVDRKMANTKLNNEKRGTVL